MSLLLRVDAEIEQATNVVLARLGGLRPDVGLILGSGLGEMVSALTDAVVLPYDNLPGFPKLSVAGHAGRLVIGRMGCHVVAMLQGRLHAYEADRGDAMAVPVGVLARLGCSILIVTNAAGSLLPEVKPGDVMMVSDHINLTARNPLIGAVGDGRFVDMVDAYDPDLRRRFCDLAVTCGMPLAEGVYMWFAGPSFETPAEIRAAKVLGADAVGMSTVPEVVLARALGMKVAAFSLITNQAAGMGSAHLSHARTLARAVGGAAKLKTLLMLFMENEA
ncbi:MAG: purine-nucleoside phosphorylase [Rhodospirillaceae bacterium]|nr:purine-nucleoside phosphorylase [Rhodospirillaceae bacterium]